MSSILKTTKLISTIRRRAFIPRDQSTFTDDDFLEMATEEVNLGLMEQIITARGDFLVVYTDVPLVADTVDYEIPNRAHGNKLRSLSLVDSDGEIVSDELTQVDLDLPSEHKTTGCFFVRNNCVVIHEDIIKDGYSLRMHFYLRPNKLVTEDRGAEIVSIIDNGDDTSTLSFTALPSHFTSAIDYDFVAAASPNKIITYSKTPTSINLTTKTITFNNTDITGVSAGDYVTLEEETIVPNVPTEYHPVIAQRVAVACLEAMGDEQNKQSAERKLAQMEKSVLGIVSNRVEGQPKKIRQRNGTLNNAILIRSRNRTF